jgi:hypothetical protein
MIFMRKKAESYKINIDGEWSLEDLYIFPQKYINIYSFIYSLEMPIEDFDDEDNRVLITYSAHPWIGGYSAVNFYTNLKYIVRPEHRPQVKSIQYSSPGWIELTAIVGIALNIKKIISCFAHSVNEINTLYNNIYKGMHERKMMKIEAKRESLKLNKEKKAFAIQAATELSGLLEFNKVDHIQKLTKNSLATLKILLSFYRQIKILRKFTDKGKANF